MPEVIERCDPRLGPAAAGVIPPAQGMGEWLASEGHPLYASSANSGLSPPNADHARSKLLLGLHREAQDKYHEWPLRPPIALASDLSTRFLPLIYPPGTVRFVIRAPLVRPVRNRSIEQLFAGAAGIWPISMGRNPRYTRTPGGLCGCDSGCAGWWGGRPGMPGGG